MQLHLQTKKLLSEYIPSDLIREVIAGIEHAEIVVSLEDTEGVNFDRF